MTPEALRGWLDRLVGVRVVVVGDVMVDRFVYCDVHRVSAGAPVPVLAHVRENVMLGGAGNGPTTVKTRFSSGAQQLLRLDTEATHPIATDVEAGIVRAVADAARGRAAIHEGIPIRLIEAARPDLLVKGADYAVGQVVGGDRVRGWGGEVRLATFVDGHSTTATLQRAAEG
jgi:bifunctional ADP-heptose synthase (sugar kinase/adenylyltransferase)